MTLAVARAPSGRAIRRLTPCLLALVFGCSGRPPPPVEPPVESPAEPSVEPGPRLWIAGDVHLGVPASDALAGLPFSPGVGVVNLEGPIAATVPPGAGVRLANGPETPARLRGAGIAVAGVVNNHQHDGGDAGAGATASALREAGLAPAGARPERVEVGGVPVAVVQIEVGDDLAAPLAAARALAETVLVGIHVTGPPSYLPRPALRAAVDEAVARGARVVYAHGTHAIGPVERRGPAVIAWGLGNLAFDCPCTRDDEGLILEIELAADGVRAAVLPIEAGLDRAPTRRAADPGAIFELLRAIDSSPLRVEGPRAWF